MFVIVAAARPLTTMIDNNDIDQQEADKINTPLSVYLEMTPHQRQGAKAHRHRQMNPSGNYPRDIDYGLKARESFRIAHVAPAPHDYTADGLMDIVVRGE